MTLRELAESQGRWLFRHRGFLPLLVLPFMLIAIRAVEHSEHLRGATPEEWYEISGLAIAFLGLALRVYTVGTVPLGTSGRNTKSQEAATLNTTGPYSIVRHPLYLGNYLMMLGCTIFTGSWWLPLFLTGLFWVYYERIAMAEEEFLHQQFGDAFTAWAVKTPAIIPNFRGWRPPVLPFSWRVGLKREYGGLLMILSCCALSELLGDLLFDPADKLHPLWAAVLCFGVLQAVTLRWMKRKTRLLNVPGRP